MPYLIDTNAWIELLRRSESPVFDRLKQVAEQEIHTCSIVEFELFVGAYSTQNSETAVRQVQTLVDRYVCLAIDRLVMAKAAEVHGHLRKVGLMIGSFDLLIAATALANNLILVTHNTREFSRVPNLKLEDWQI